MKSLALSAALFVSVLAPASTLRDLEPESVEVANVLFPCLKDYEQATLKGESISRIVYIAPRPSNPDLITESWNFYVVDAQVTPGNPKPVANLIVTRTTDRTGHILPGAQPKISFRCELIPQ